MIKISHVNVFLLFLVVVNIFISHNMKGNFNRLHTEIVPNPPSEKFAQIFSMGDKEFYFRTLGLRLQDFGNDFGKYTSLGEYDYTKLVRWFDLMDSLNSKSNFVPSLASYYYGNVGIKDNLLLIIDYLVRHSDLDMENKWWWRFQAAHIVKYKLKDIQTSKDLLEPLYVMDNIPSWARIMYAVTLSNLGENESAIRILNIIADSFYGSKDQAELNYMKYFLQDKINKIKNSQN